MLYFSKSYRHIWHKEKNVTIYQDVYGMGSEKLLQPFLKPETLESNLLELTDPDGSSLLAWRTSDQEVKHLMFLNGPFL